MSSARARRNNTRRRPAPQIIDGELRFQGLVASVDGSQIYRSSKVGAPADAEKIGREAGEEIKAEAGIEFFEWLQQQEEPAAVSA